PVVPKSWVLDLFRRATLMRLIGEPVGTAFRIALRSRLRPARVPHSIAARRVSSQVIDWAWYTIVIAPATGGSTTVIRMIAPHLSLNDVGTALVDGLITLIRVVILIVLASALWVPVGVIVGLRPRVTQFVQPLAQFLAAFPANLLFPIAVVLIV